VTEKRAPEERERRSDSSQPATGGWVACSERMPDIEHTEENDGCSKWVLVFAPARGRDMAFWDGTRWYWGGGGYAIQSEVTHWIDMPSPPRSEP